MPNGSPVSGAVKVMLKILRGDQVIAFTDQEGRFELNSVAPGQYTLETDSDREQRFEGGVERVQVQRGVPTLVTIYLKEKRETQRLPADKSISVAMFDQKVPAAARKEFEKASRLSTEGATTESIEALRRAIAIYPDYLMAHNDLGAQLLERGSLDEAALELRAAIKIDPKASNPQINLGIVLVRLNNFSEALVTLDKALSLEPASPAAHLYAGLASVKLGDAERGAKELTAAHELGGSPYAIALFYLGQLCLQKGERELALKSFQSYLVESPNAVNATQVEKLIATLRQAP
jgi:tetratricopeptide (TPR) repeat protein